MKEIKLNRGYIALVDDEDYEYLNQFKWHVVNGYGTDYACRSKNGETKLMHRLIMNTPKGLTVDHLDFNGLNNQKINLKNCTLSENSSRVNPNKKKPIKRSIGTPRVLRLDLSETERREYDEACRALASTLPKMTTHLVRQFLTKFYAKDKPNSVD